MKILSEDNRSLICQALREKASNDELRCLKLQSLPSHRLAEQFSWQARQGRDLADMLENAAEIKIVI